ncbi:MAG: TetR/AcrR family transcriptional regulator [Steroidobacteraceae bacterium]
MTGELSEIRSLNRLRILDKVMAVASEELAEKGPEELSLRHIARRLGCAIGTIYLYFKDKDALVDAIVDAGFAGLLTSLQAVDATMQPREQLRVAFHSYVRYGLENQNLYRCAFCLPRPPDRPLRRPHQAYEHLVHLVGTCRATGLFQHLATDLAAQTIWVAAHGLTSLLVLRPDFPWTAREVLINSVMETTLSGLDRLSTIHTGKKSNAGTEIG